MSTIALEVPTDLFGTGGQIGVWASISRRRDDGTLEQMDRGGNPTINPFINPDGEKDRYNSRQPVDDVDNYLLPWSKVLENGGYPPEEAQGAAAAVSCPTSCAMTSPSPSPTRTAASHGRRLQLPLRLAELGKVSPQGLKPHADLLTDFPYLGPPNP